MRARHDAVAVEARRLYAAQLLEQGWRQADVARAVGVSRQSVARWADTLGRDGPSGLRGARGGVLAVRAAGTWNPRDPVSRPFIPPASRGGLLRRESLPQPAPRSVAAAERWRHAVWPRWKRRALVEERAIVLLTGSRWNPHVRGRRGGDAAADPSMTCDHRDQSSCVACGAHRFLLRLVEGSIEAAHALDFLQVLRGRLEAPLLVVCDGLHAAHRGALEREVSRWGGSLALVFPPALVGGVDPVQLLWGETHRRESRLHLADALHAFRAHTVTAAQALRRPAHLLRASWSLASPFGALTTPATALPVPARTTAAPQAGAPTRPRCLCDCQSRRAGA